MVTELALILNWFGSDGYKADIHALRKLNPDMKTSQEWLQKTSPLPKK
jgi:hypothetical protein